MENDINQTLTRAINKHKEGNLQEAEYLYKEVLKSEPNHLGSNNNLGVILEGFGKLKEAEACYRKTIKIKSDYASGYNNLGNVLKILGKFDEAKENYKKAIKLKPDFAEAYNNMGLVQDKLNKLDDARICYQKAIEIKPNFIESYLNLGVVLERLGRIEESIASYKKAIELKPNFAEAYYNLGIIYSKNNKLDEALISAKKAIELKPEYADGYYNLADIQKQLENFDEAEVNYKKAIELKPDYIGAYNNLGLMLGSLGRLEEAKSSIKNAIKISPNSHTSYNNLAIIQYELERFDESEACYRKAIELKPDYANVYNNLGVLLADLDRQDEADISFNKAIELKPNFNEALNELGLRAHERSQYKKAAEYFILSDTAKNKGFLLRCYYLLNEKTNFYNQLDYLLNKGESNAVIGSLISRSKIKYGISKTNPFCNDPLNYVLKKNLIEDYDFKNIFVKGASDILSDKNVKHRSQILLTNGIQTKGNIFNKSTPIIDEIEKIIRTEVEKYYVHFKKSEEGFLKNWSKNYKVKGWLVSMKNGGKLSPHIHEYGWLSGSVYINVPPKLNTDSGNLVVCTTDEHELVSDKYKKSIDVVTGSLCIFPSSLYHHTIPFKSDEERIVLAFDIVPK